MNAFIISAVFGGVVLVLQLLLGVAGAEGAGHDVAHDSAHSGHSGEKGIGGHLTSLRSIAAAIAFFGVAGEAARRASLGGPIALAIALAAGLTAAVVVAMLTRAMLRFDTDGVVRVGAAVGTTGTVYVPVPAGRTGAGKVQLVLQGRLVECAAVTSETALATGEPVLVIDVLESETLVVVRAPAELTGA